MSLSTVIAGAVQPKVRASMLGGLIKTVRPHQWVKNLFVMAPMFFHKDVFVTANGVPALNLLVTGRAALATMVFCLLAGAVYTINDLVDVEADRVHPVKRNRPIASGAVPQNVARAMAAGLVVASLGLAYAINWSFAAVAAVYFVENLAYTFKLKKIAFLDVGLIAFGFVLRVYAGGLATDTKVSGYMIACTALLALFLGFGKRRHELASANAGKQRAALEAYSHRALTTALAITGVGSVAVYLAYTFDPPPFFGSTRWLWVTTLHPLFGVIRFMELVIGRPKAESPTQEMLRDVPSVLNVVLWVAEILAIIGYVRFQ
jgi:decaprenyl-phosphate phosphoribosyltransferase